MPRPSCLHCYLKHVTSAMVLNIEYREDEKYAIHKYYCIGHLNEAAAESIQSFPELAGKTRLARLSLMDDDLDPNYEALVKEAHELLEANKEKQRAKPHSDKRSRPPTSTSSGGRATYRVARS